MSGLRCAACGTELASGALACPACTTLVHAARLKQLAVEADIATRGADFRTARDRWAAALRLLPPESRQHASVQSKVAELAQRMDEPGRPGAAGADGRPWWRRGVPGVVAVGVLVLSKLKFLLLGLTKASTFFSMFAFFGLYWSIYGWPLALGLVVSIYVHEMGHVAMLRRLGIDAGAPMFIPGVGALVMLRQHVTDPLTDALIGLAGPVWGFGAGIVALAVYQVTGIRVWLAIAELTGFLNLFNLVPVWQLDGARGMHVLARHERWVLVGVIAVALLLTGQRMLLIIGGVAIWRALQQESGPGDSRILATYAGLVVALSWLAKGVQ